MTCNEIENKLPAYLEGVLSRDEREGVAGHLASCPGCSRALEDLKAAEQIVRNLEEVEPPPFFEQKIMARIREEAERKPGIIRRLFYPLHIKIPVQALATVLIAVLAFYVYQTGDPELKRMVPFPIPMAEPDKEKVQAESAKSALPPSATTPVKETVRSESARPATSPPSPTSVTRARAGDLSEKDRQQFAAPRLEKGTKEERMIDLRAPMREGRPDAMEQAAPAMAAREKEIAPAGKQVFSQAREGTGKRDADQALEALSEEQKRKEKLVDTGVAVGESRKAMSAPPAPRMAAGATVQRSVMDLTIQVVDTAAAVRKIEAHLSQTNSPIIERGRRDGSEFLKAEMAALDVTLFLKQLEAIGRVNVEKEPPVEPGVTVIVHLKIVGRP